MSSTCVLIPSYNEARSIGGIVRELKEKGLDVFVVDDGSTDNTASIAESQGAIVVKHKVNKGKGASLQEGFKHILKKNFDAVMIMDGDGQHKVSDIDGFLSKMEETGADVIIGNRMMDISSMPLIRIHTNRFMSNLISIICGQKIPDSQCGFRLIKREVLDKIRLTSSNYEIESELIIEAAKKGFKVESVPIMTVYEDEKSKINPVIDTLRFLFFLIKLSLRK
ncbi:MAG: glycosyltransferase family 2 protein [Candidatus Omnitrophota bacterium]|nr:glycosyltransferase family 2 protein [Candidatus Omnitrophota bacterium]